MPARRPYVFLALIAALFAAGYAARQELGIELSREGMESLVAGLGWKAPAFFVAMMTFRQFLALPSALVLSIGGVVFGAVLGSALGALGILLSALFGYSVSRGAGRELLHKVLGSRADDFHRRANVAGPFLVGLATAHPAGPMSPFHWGAGLAAIPAFGFVFAVAVGAPIRASLYAFFGSTLLELWTPRFFVATGVLAGVALLPLAHGPTRQRLAAAFRPPGKLEHL